MFPKLVLQLSLHYVAMWQLFKIIHWDTWLKQKHHFAWVTTVCENTVIVYEYVHAVCTCLQLLCTQWFHIFKWVHSRGEDEEHRRCWTTFSEGLCKLCLSALCIFYTKLLLHKVPEICQQTEQETNRVYKNMTESCRTQRNEMSDPGSENQISKSHEQLISPIF